MFVTDEMIDGMARWYGKPLEKQFDIETTPEEIERIRSSQKEGRNHDVTVYAIKNDRVIVIAKHSYPPGLYRAPSGGLAPNESFRDGIAREMFEETGCKVELEKFVLKTAVKFSAGNEIINWRSFVFLAQYVTGDFNFTDRREIKEVRLADWSEFDQFSRIMRSSDIGGLHYRAALHDAVVALL